MKTYVEWLQDEEQLYGNLTQNEKELTKAAWTASLQEAIRVSLKRQRWHYLL